MSVTTQTLVASAAYTESGTSESTSLPGTASELNVYIDCTAASGTTPTLDVVWQVSPDGTTWYTHTAATQITEAGQQVLKLSNIGGYGRVSYTIGGTTPSLTFSVVAEPKWGI